MHHATDALGGGAVAPCPGRFSPQTALAY